MSKKRWLRNGLGALAVTLSLGAAAFGSYSLVTASDHVDSPLTTGDQAADIADVYTFQNGSNLVLAMTISNVQAAPEIQLGRSIFDPEVLYQFKIENDGDAVEDLVIQAYVTGNPTNQVMHFVGPVEPDLTGTSARIVNGPQSAAVRVSTGENPLVATRDGMMVFAGVRDDPFFFDVGQFSAILAGQATSFNDPGIDAFAGLNVFAIVVELPMAALGDPSTLSVWGTTSRP